MNCGTLNHESAKFCMGCGHSLKAKSEQPKDVNGCASAPSGFDGDQVQTRIDEVKNFNTQMTQVWNHQPVTHCNLIELLLLVLDISGSMDGQFDRDMNKLQAANRAQRGLVLQKMSNDSNDEIGIVTFNHEAHCRVKLGPIHAISPQVLNTLQSLRAGGGTAQHEGLAMAEKNFEWHRENVLRRIVLLTDGHGGDPVPVAERLKSRGVVIDVVGVGHDPSAVNEPELKQTASVIQGESHYFFIKNYNTLVETFTHLSNKTNIY